MKFTHPLLVRLGTITTLHGLRKFSNELGGQVYWHVEPKAKTMVISRFPGANELETHYPYMGFFGRIIRDAIKNSNIEGPIHWTYLVKEKFVYSKSKYLYEKWNVILKKEIEIVKPKYIVTVGIDTTNAVKKICPNTICVPEPVTKQDHPFETFSKLLSMSINGAIYA